MQPDLLVGTTRLLHECKGAPLAILIALLAWRKPAPQTMVQRMTGYNAETVRIGLETLESLGYAQRAGELGWLLSAEARQLPLFGTEALEPAAENPRLAAGDDGNDPAAGDAQGEKHTPFYEGEGGAENPRLGSSSGGCLIVKSINALKPPPPPPTTATAENPRLAAGDDELVELLVARTACPRRRAREAIGAALDAGYFRPFLELQILLWSAFSRERPTIRSPGHFVAAKVQDGEEAPAWVKFESNEDYFRAEDLRRQWAAESAAKRDG